MALSDEVNSCSYNSKGDPRVKGRPQTFCDIVTCQSALTVEGAATIIPPSLTVGGVTYVPTNVIVVVSPGSPAASGVPAVPPTYAMINVLAAAAAGA